MAHPIKLDPAHARRFLLARHALAPPRKLASIAAVMKRLGSLQVDPLAVTGLKNHDLVLAARLSKYRPELLERALYRDRTLVEVYDKSLCIVPVAELPFHAAEWVRKARAIRRERGEYDAAVRRFGPALLARLEREGPLSSRELGRAGGKIVAGWGLTTEARAALHVLVRIGKVLTVARRGNQRFYDRAERVVAPSLLEPVDHAASVRHRVLGRFRAMGLLGISPSAEVFIATAKAKERVRVIQDLVAEHILIRADVRGVGERFLLASDLPLVEATAAQRRAPPGAALVAPLDPLIWDRTLLGPLFGVEYKWGVYTPRHARSGGYYDLPVVYRDRIVGMIEPVFDRAARAMRIVRLDLGVRPDRALMRAIRAAVDAHARAAGAGSVEWPRAAAQYSSTLTIGK